MDKVVAMLNGNMEIEIVIKEAVGEGELEGDKFLPP
jgi:hypothetical protein